MPKKTEKIKGRKYERVQRGRKNLLHPVKRLQYLKV
jgi:hypothetical protein